MGEKRLQTGEMDLEIKLVADGGAKVTLAVLRGQWLASRRPLVSA
jgi:hypothetical protein